jgi:hypothetical protein
MMDKIRSGFKKLRPAQTMTLICLLTVFTVILILPLF